MSFEQRVKALPTLGIGVSTEYGAFTAPESLELLRLASEYPKYAQFLEVGVEVSKGLDEDAVSWVQDGRATTYHFLDVNLEDPRDFDPSWLEAVQRLAKELQPAWMCGDAGLWHFGRRDRGQMLLLPPVLSRDSAKAMAEGIIRLREETGLEVFPENPPGHVYLGDLHLLDFFALLTEFADTGMLLDAAHLAIYQHVMGYSPKTGLDGFPLERIVEVHVAGATSIEVDGLHILEDDHTVQVRPETWDILESVAGGATNLKAVVFECERNTLELCLPGFQRIDEIIGSCLGAP